MSKLLSFLISNIPEKEAFWVSVAILGVSKGGGREQLLGLGSSGSNGTIAGDNRKDRSDPSVLLLASYILVPKAAKV